MMLGGRPQSKTVRRTPPTEGWSYVAFRLALRIVPRVASFMSSALIRTTRYVRTWLTGRADVTEEDVVLDRDGTPIPATLLRRRGAREPLPGWIVMHGITRPGRSHPQLVRFTRALAATGAAVLVPDVPEWRKLDLAPTLTRPTILRAIQAFDGMSDVRTEGYGLIGFSFGAPHTIASMADPAIRDRVLGAIGFGGYCHLESTINFMFTGEHEYGGQSHTLRPDPYGRWIVAANYLTSVPGYEDAGDVARELRRLAALSGDTGAVAWDPIYDPAKVEARSRIEPDRLPLFDLIAPASNEEPDLEEGRRMAGLLTETGSRIEPGMEARPDLAEVERPVHIIHGYKDHLIPYTEGHRLQDALVSSSDVRATVTRLFGHSAQDPFPSPAQAIREVPLFLRAIGRALETI